MKSNHKKMIKILKQEIGYDLTEEMGRFEEDEKWINSIYYL